MVRLRIPQKRKEQVDAILYRLGLTSTQVVNILFAQIVAHKSVPFAIGLPKDSDVSVPIEHVAKIWNSLDDTDYSYLKEPTSGRCWMDPKPGEVYFVDLGITAKPRPAVIVSRFDPDRPLAIVSFAPITSQHRGSQYEVPLGRPPFLREDSWVNVQAVAPIDHHKLGRKIGKLTDVQMDQVKKALAYLFNF
jgi:mRNA interferase MazF